MRVDDKEDVKTNDGQHDDLGISPEQRQAEVDNLKDMYADESAAKTPGGDKASEKEKAANGIQSDQVGSGYVEEDGGKPGFRKRFASARRTKQFLAAGTVIGVLVGLVMAFMAFLLPFKLTHIIESIEQRVGQVPEYAVEQRLEYYMSRYLMIQALDATGQFDFGEGGADRNRFTYLGKSFWDTMYVNWKGAKLEEKLLTGDGLKLKAKDIDPGIFRSGKLRANTFELENLNVAEDSSLRNTSLDRTEARQLIKQFAREETKSRQVLKRFNMRRVMKKYYGVGNWKPHEKKTDKARNAYQEGKRNLKKRVVNETVGRVSERYDKYLQCLLDATTGKQCRDLLKRADVNLNLGDGDKNNDGRAQTEELIDADNSSGDHDSNRTLSRRISAQIQEFGLKKIIASLAAGIGVIDTVNHIYKSIDSGVINQVIYDKNAQQYLAYGATFFSAEGQFKVGEDFDIEDMRATYEIFKNFEESPVYQAGNNGSVDVVNAASQIRRDCNNDDQDGKETLLEEGETVCPDKRLLQNKTEFTESEGWKALGVLSDLYSGTVGGIVSFFTELVGKLTSFIGLDALIQGLMEAFNISELIAKGFGKLLNLIAAPVVTGAEVGGEAYDNLFAAVAVRQSSVGGEVGVAKEDTIGGAYLSQGQVLAIREAQMDDYYNELENKSFFARYFSPEVKESLVGSLAMHAPVSVTDFSTKAVAAISSPLDIFSSLANALNPRVKAQNMPDSNPFHALPMGFSANHEIFTANNGEGMDTDELHAKYQCDKPADQRPQNIGEGAFGRPDDIPFDIPLIPDPCLLEESVTDASTRFFTGETTDNDLINDQFPDATGSPIIPRGVECPAILEPHPSEPNYYKMPDAPNGEYTIYSTSARRYGSKQLVCVLYTVGLEYNRAYAGKSRVRIGDLNAGGHASHFRGIAVDVDAGGEIAAADHTDAAAGKYNTQATVDLGKAFINTGIIRNLWWCDPSDGSLRTIIEYAQSRNTPLVGAKCIGGHQNHFHIDINLDYALPGSFTP